MLLNSCIMSIDSTRIIVYTIAIVKQDTTTESHRIAENIRNSKQYTCEGSEPNNSRERFLEGGFIKEMEEKVMCITKSELEQKVQEIRKYKAMAEEAEAIRRSLEAEVITYLKENDIEKEVTDSAVITYKAQTRVTLDKEKLTEILGDDLKPFEKISTYNVLRIK